MLIKLAKNKSDKYNQYHEYKNGDLINPATKTMSTPKEVYEKRYMR